MIKNKINFLVFCILLISCDYSPYNHDYIEFDNDSNSLLYVQFNIENNPLYYNEYHIDKYCILIESKERKKIGSSFMLGWEEFVASLPNKTVSFFISDTMLYKCDMSNIETHILQRYDLSLKDLEFLDWEISYPPSEKMKDMKMRPPYNPPYNE
ncbi:MAG: hypothetical protein LBU84_18030 [Prevotella sp.]|jgi:hypothetical protein|nr:hypothetical protein [Prevotella sp.]